MGLTVNILSNQIDERKRNLKKLCSNLKTYVTGAYNTQNEITKIQKEIEDLNESLRQLEE